MNSKLIKESSRTLSLELKKAEKEETRKRQQEQKKEKEMVAAQKKKEKADKKEEADEIKRIIDLETQRIRCVQNWKTKFK